MKKNYRLRIYYIILKKDFILHSQIYNQIYYHLLRKMFYIEIFNIYHDKNYKYIDTSSTRYHNLINNFKSMILILLICRKYAEHKTPHVCKIYNVAYCRLQTSLKCH